MLILLINKKFNRILRELRLQLWTKGSWSFSRALKVMSAAVTIWMTILGKFILAYLCDTHIMWSVFFWKLIESAKEQIAQRIVLVLIAAADGKVFDKVTNCIQIRYSILPNSRPQCSVDFNVNRGYPVCV